MAGDGTIVYSGGDGYFYVIRSAGVAEQRFWTSSTWAYSSPAIAPDGTIYFGTGAGGLHAVEGVAGLAEQQWPMFRENLRHTGVQGQP